MQTESEAAAFEAAKGTGGRAKGLLAAGGILAALGAASCCVLPSLLLIVGAGGVWISALAALGPYQPVFLFVAVACLALGFRLVYRRPLGTCEAPNCRPPSYRAVKIGLWAGTALLAAAAGFPFVTAMVP